MLIDTGPDETYPALKARLEKLPMDSHGKRHIDLFVVTHIDHDHIGGAALLLNDPSLNLSFGDIWFNAPPRPQTRGAAEGDSLAKILCGVERQLPWNVAWSGQPVSTPAEAGGVELTGRGLPKITLLSPTPERLQALYKVWAKELARLRSKQREAPEPEPAAVRGTPPTLEALAASVTPTDKAVANGSSIAMLLEHQGASVLLGADAFPTVLVPALAALSKRRGTVGPLNVDAVKLSHHGSRANVTQDLMRSVEAEHFVFSTNGAYFKHPNAEAVAHVIVGRKQPVLWFNYGTPNTRRWAADELTQKYDYTARYPTEFFEGVVVELPRRRVIRQS
jgi:beta-lactamase superfamily II metal-dependent hydrolase